MTQLVILDESRAKHFPLYGVGGIIVSSDDVLDIERKWVEAKASHGMSSLEVKYSAKWSDGALRHEFMRNIATFPVHCVVALLEDFRPKKLRDAKESAGDLYIQRRAFEFVLQRLGEAFATNRPGPHFVVFDHRTDLKQLAQEYERHHAGEGWAWGERRLESPSRLGYSASLFASANGPLIEIADMVVSAVTRWAGARCAAQNGKKINGLADLDRDCAAVRDLFPSYEFPERWRGRSVITFTQNRTKRELLGEHIDAWLRELPVPIHEAREAVIDQALDND